MTELYLIRHGEGIYQVEKIVPGMQGDGGLSPLGVKQAERLRDRLAATGEIKADVLIASPLPRARQTAEIIAPALGLPILFDQEVEEMRPGEADGLTFAEADAKYGEYPDYRVEPFRVHAPGSENWPQFVVRASAALYRITHEYEGKTIVIVCHGGVVDGSLSYFFGLSANLPTRVALFCHNASITQWRKGILPKHPDVWQLVNYNDALHLRGLDSGRSINWAALAGAPVVGRDQTAVPLPTQNPE
jgi:probable phosphoglycerate mutase